MDAVTIEFEILKAGSRTKWKIWGVLAVFNHFRDPLARFCGELHRSSRKWNGKLWIWGGIIQDDGTHLVANCLESYFSWKDLWILVDTKLDVSQQYSLAEKHYHESITNTSRKVTLVLYSAWWGLIRCTVFSFRLLIKGEKYRVPETSP